MLPQTFVFIKKNRCAIYLSLVGIVCLILSTKGISDESVVSLNGDMPRYMMNGVYFHDLIRDFPISHPIAYTYQYFARYPALSLGHHPLLPGIAEVPFYAIFGISVFSARLMTVCFMLLAGMAWFLLIRAVYDEEVAFLSAILFVTTPFIVGYSRIVMSEIPAVALIILSTFYFYQYCHKNDNRYGYAFAASLVLALFTRQQLVFMLPVFLSYFLITRKPKITITKKVLICGMALALLLLPLVFITLKYSQINVRWIVEQDLASRLGLRNLLYYPKILAKFHLTPLVLILSLVSIAISVYRRDRRALIFLLWISIYWLLLALTNAKTPRYAIYWIPPYCLFAAAIVSYFGTRSSKVMLSCLLLVIAGYQFAIGMQSRPSYATGYEQAARYVVEKKKGESLLFSANVDTGYFVFFVRKHDPGHEAIVLRADKLLVTSMLQWIVEKRISDRAEIYRILQDFGVGYVVIEDRPLKFSPLKQAREKMKSDRLAAQQRKARRVRKRDPLKWLREEVESDKFILRKRIPIRSDSEELRDATLSIYEYKDYTPPQPGKVLDMNIPLMGDSIAVQFDDLLRKNSQNARSDNE